MKNNPCSTCLHSNHGEESKEPKKSHWEADIEGYKAMYVQSEVAERWYKRNMRTIQTQAEIAEQQYKRNTRTIHRTGKAEVI